MLRVAVCVFTPCDGESVGCRCGDTGRRWRAWFVWIGGAHQHFTGTALSLHVRRYELQGGGIRRKDGVKHKGGMEERRG